MELKFKRDTSFRKQFFVPDSFAHPAKMDAQLLIWIVERYTKPGEIILDPMAGMGTTMLACTLGRNVVLVELEEKFCLMMTGGDCDGFKCALCSQRMEWETIDTEEDFLLLADKQFPKNKQLEIAFERYGWEWTRKQILRKYPEGEHCIVGNWEQVKQRPQFRELGGDLGNCQIIQGDARQLEGLLVDKCIFSPPYAEAHDTKNLGVGDGDRADLRAYSWLKEDNPENISNLPYGQIEKIVTSPPFQEPEIRRSGQDKSREDYNYGSKLKMSSEHPDNISKLAERDYGNIDSIITSPPYEEAQSGGGIAQKGYQGPKHGPTDLVGKRSYMPENIGNTEGNIGNLKSASYLEAMLQVYQQCRKCLKPQGLMILVTKNFIREKQVVRLDSDTIKLCEQAGFAFVARHYRKLLAQSFWRIIYHQKHPEVEQIKLEDILVFGKEFVKCQAGK